MSELGLSLADYTEEQTYSLWPDNRAPMQLFQALFTQWRMGPGGPIGLDYNVLPFVMRMLGLDEQAWPELFEDLKILEDAALAQFARRKNA